MVEKEGFGAFKNNNMLLFELLFLKHRLCNINLHARSLRGVFIDLLIKQTM